MDFKQYQVLLVVIILLSAVSVTEASDFPFSFFVKTPHATLSYPNKTVSGLSESECAEECLYEAGFDCLSVEYYWPSGACSLSVASATSQGRDLATDKYYNYYEKLVGECSFPAVGLEDGSVSLDDVTMSSFLGDMEDGPIGISKANIRLNSDGAWCTKELDDINNIEDWVQVEYHEFKLVGAVATQGFRHPDLDPVYVTQYYLKYRNATDEPWIEYEEGGQTKIFTANTDQDTVVKNDLANPFVAKFVRIYPTACRNHPCMRLEFYACRVDCEPNPCKNNATCLDDIPAVWNVTCTCPLGYVGGFCQVDFDECASDPCQNGATCTDHVDYFTCDCAPGWDGTVCDENIDECLSNPCQNDAICTDLVDGYNCTCPYGFQGVHCENFTVVCEAGFVEGLFSCYSIVSDAQNHTDYDGAVLACRSVHGHLAYPGDYTEQTVISDALKLRDASGVLFIGLKYNGTAVVYDDDSGGPDLSSWDDNGTSVTYWASGYPSGSSECMGMIEDGHDWKWRNVDCNAVKGYICEQNRTDGGLSEWSGWSSCSVTCGPGEGVQIRTRDCTHPAPLLQGQECNGTRNETEICGTICPIVECPEGFITNYDKCYLLRTNQSATYAEARTACQNLTVYGGHLILLNDLDEEAFVTQMLAGSYADAGETFFTGNRLDSQGNVTLDWVFADSAGPLNLTSWELAGESPWGNQGPPGSGQSGCIQLALNGSVWRWELGDCSGSLGYICEVNLADGKLGSWNPWGECDSTCGAGNQTRERWCEAPAPILGGANCTGPTEDSSGCSSICPTVTCPSGFSAHYDSCYTVIDEPNLYRSRDQAQSYCANLAYRAHLSYVQSDHELDFVSFRLDDSNVRDSEAVWTGLRYESGELTYLNGSEAVNISAWVGAGPWAEGYGQGASDACVGLVYDKPEWRWRMADASCDDSLGFVCELTQAPGDWGSWGAWAECSVSCGNGTQTRYRQCDDPAPVLGGDYCPGTNSSMRNCSILCPIVSCPSGFDVYYDSCYLTVDGQDDFASFDSANASCFDLTSGDGRLAHVDDYGEQEFLSWGLKNLQVNTTSAAYVGMTYSSPNVEFYLASGGPDETSYPGNSIWARGYPDAAGGGSCMGMVYNDPTWEWLLGNVHCDVGRSYICEITQGDGNWGSWGAWSQCSESCGEGTQTRLRSCNDPPPILAGNDCEGSDDDTRGCNFPCPVVSCPDDFEVAHDSCYRIVDDSSLYTDYEGANSSCASVTNHTGHLLYADEQIELLTISWKLKVSETATANAFHTGMKYESASLIFDDGLGSPNLTSWGSGDPWRNGYPTSSGYECVVLLYNGATWEWKLGNKECDGSHGYVCEITQTDGNWASWGTWGDCSLTCDEAPNMGSQMRNRTCSNPAPILSGNYCEGNATDVQACGSQCPPVHGNYSEWFYDNCSASCYTVFDDDDPTARYGGLQNRTHYCTNPEPQYGGNDCIGDATEVVSCGTQDGNACPPVNGSWSAWGNFSDCSATCGGGTRNRTRQCDDPKTQNGGESCPGNGRETENCNTDPCPVDGNYTAWSLWSTCSSTCVGGTQYRERNCTDPEPAHGGMNCTGEDLQWQNCSDDTPCPVDGQYSDWSAWSNCTVECEGVGSQNRTRTCTDPAPAYGGSDCPAAQASSESRVCGTQNCPIDGGFSDWLGWSACTAQCGTGGVRYRHRPCTSPTPQYGGRDCIGDAYIREGCDSSVPCRDTFETVALNRPSTQSSTLGNATSQLAVDGNTNASLTATSCSQTKTERDPWWQVDLGGVYQVKEVKVHGSSLGCDSDDCDWGVLPFIVRVGISETVATNIRYGELQTTSNSSQVTVKSGSPQYGRYIVVQRIHDDATLTLCEVQVVVVSSTFHVNGSAGPGSLTFDQAEEACNKRGAELSSYDDLYEVWASDGLDGCSLAWLSDRTVRCPIQAINGSCSLSENAGIYNGGSQMQNETYDAYCTTRGPEGEPLGLISGLITDSQITVSSVNQTGSCSGAYARLYHPDTAAAWVPAKHSRSQWIQIDLGAPVTLKAVATSGLPCCDSWVTGYYIKYAWDDNDWKYYMQNDTIKFMVANYDSSSIVRNTLPEPIPNVRYLRIEPRTWNTSISLRLELFGDYEPVNGEWSSWGSWGGCSVPCESVGTWQRSRSCDSPAPSRKGLRCREDPYRDRIANPLKFFSKTSQAVLADQDTETLTKVSSPRDCALTCLWDRPECQSFEYDPVTLDCTLSNTSSTVEGAELSMHNSSDYYELVYTSCNAHNIVNRGRGITPASGLYDIIVDGNALSVYCDMDRDGGGWTLLVTSATAYGWDNETVLLRNASRPSIEDDYSILTYADSIKDTGIGKTFKYRLESINRGQWGGIYEAPSNYSFVSSSNGQRASLVEMFNNWRPSNTSLDHVMPWLTSNYPLLLSILNNTLDDGGDSYGALVCACGNRTWKPYMKDMESSVFGPCPEAPETTAQARPETTPNAGETTQEESMTEWTTEMITEMMNLMTDATTTDATVTDATMTDATATDATATDATTTVATTTDATTTVATTTDTTTTVATTTDATVTVAMTTDGATTQQPADEDSCYSGPKTIWYWLREEIQEYQPSLQWDLSGRCSYDADLTDCSEPCFDESIPPTVGGHEGASLVPVSLVDSKNTSQYTCSISLSDNYIRFNSLNETCLADPALCTQGFTVGLWVRLNHSDSVGERVLLSTGGAGIVGRGVSIKTTQPSLSSTLQMTVQVIDANIWTVSTSAALPDQEWFYITIVYSPSKSLLIYIDGYNQGSTNTSESTYAGSQTDENWSLVLGAAANDLSNSSLRLNTDVSDLKVFYSQLSSREVELFYLGIEPGYEGDLCGEWFCPIHGNLSSWLESGECSVDCGDGGTILRQRNCSNPAPQYGGDDCVGATKEWIACSTASTCQNNEDSALGLEEGNITDAYLTESSCYDNDTTCATSARIGDTDTTHCWIPASNDTSEWMMVELADGVTLRAVGTMGRTSDTSYVTEYLISYSSDGSNWQFYQESGDDKVFRGNYDDQNLVRQPVTISAEVFYVKFHPLSWVNQICLRVELYGYYNPIDGEWSSWTSWDQCDVTCGGGTQYRNRTCEGAKYGGSMCSGSDEDSQTCNDNACPIDGNWGAWSTVVDCSVSCGSNGIYYRERTCDDPSPQYGGNSCSGSDSDWEACQSQGTCEGDEETELGVADGSLADSQLSESSCSASGDHCAAWGRLDDSDSGHCWIPVTSDDNPWMQVNLTESVTLSAVATQGRPSDTNYVTSYYLQLSEDGNSWSYYEDGSSAKLFQGNIDNVDTVRHELSGVSSVTLVRFLPESANGSICLRVELYGTYNPIDGAYSEWSAWDTCSVTCGGSTRSRSRTCDNPSAKYGGADCSEASTDSETCNANPCPIDGGYSSWVDVTDCTVDCGNYGTLMQERYCNDPSPQYGGANCTGISEQWVGCNTATPCSATENTDLGMDDETIDDSMITVSEGTGNNYAGSYARLHENQADHAWVPANPDTDDYLQIELPDTITLRRVAVEGRSPNSGSDQWVTTFSLSTSLNGSDWDDYMEDGEVKVFRGSFDAGTEVASSLANPVNATNYVRFHPVTWNEAIAMRVELYGKYNPIAGEWSQWTSWTSCSVTCAGSTVTRERACDSPAPKYGGDDCPAADASSESKTCNTQPCPIDGDWTTWTSWASIPCSISCGDQGLKHRTRTCSDPAPQYNGSDCTNPSYTEEFKTCDASGNCDTGYEALGMTDGRIKDDQISATSVKSATDNQARHGRLNIGTTAGRLCWEPVNNTGPHMLQVDLTTPALLRMIGVQGMETGDQWVTYYNMSYSTDGTTWTVYQDSNGDAMIFYGNIDKTGVVKTELDPSVDDVVSVRLFPHAWNDAPCLRTELYGMYNPTACASSSVELTASVSEESGSPDYLEVDLSSLQTVTMVSTKGSGQKWLVTYRLFFSQNNVDWALYVEDGQPRVFIGNSDNVDYVANPLANPIDAVYLRLVPTEVYNGLSDLVMVYGCSSANIADAAPLTSVCFDTFGISNYVFDMDRITVSSILNFTLDNGADAEPGNTTRYHPRYAHLRNPESVDSGRQGWVSEPGGLAGSLDQWLAVDFGERVTLTGLALQGVELPEGDVGLARFSLHFSEDNVIWNALRKMNSPETNILTGPTDSINVTLVELSADGEDDIRPLTLRYLRIQSEVNTTDSVGLRLELYGCSAAVGSVCKTGWSEFENSCYKFTRNDTKNWLAAKSMCESEDAHLVVVNSLREQEFLQNFPRAYGEDDFLIDLNRRDDYGTFVWSDGTFFAFAAWADGEPSDDLFDGCTALSKGKRGRWVSVDCGESRNYACEYERESTTYTVCGENDWLMACPDDHTVNVTDVQWGRSADWQTCPQASTFSTGILPCSSDTAGQDVEDACRNTTRCGGLADVSEFNYPCSQSDIYLYLSTTYGCAKDNIENARACQDDFLYLSCPSDDQVLHIVQAMYGRTMDNSVCPGPDRDAITNCTSSSGLQTVRTYCEGHYSCKIAVEVASFGSDPCEGVAKYLDVNYTCVSDEVVIQDVYEFQGECESGWLKHNQRCIKAFPNATLTFEDADDHCNDLHGHLAGIPSSNTQGFLEGLLSHHPASKNFWVGCVQTNNDTCRWRDGSRHAFTDFNPQFASVAGERCIELRGADSFKWEDAPCANQNAFICQQDCMLTFGMIDKTIGNHQLEVSSTKLVATLDSFKWDARLHAPYGAWIAAESNTDQYYQIDFERVMRVRKIATQGHPKYDYWIEQYRLDYTVNDTANGSVWMTYQEEGLDKIFQANNDSNSVEYQYFDHFMFARYLRLIPLNWTGEISLRMEVYGCYLQDNKPEVLEVVNITKLHYEYNGTIQCRAFGIPLPTMRWERDGYTYSGGENATIVTRAVDDYHMITEVQFHPLSDDRGFYTCVAQNTFGSHRKSFYNPKGLPTFLGGNIICDDELLTYSCPEGEYIKITNAFYGREHNEKCIIYDDFYPVTCAYDPDTVLRRLERQCNNKRHCMVYVSEAMFGESGASYPVCDGFPLYLNVTRECVGLEWTSWFNTDDGTGQDIEARGTILATYDEMCYSPLGIECRLASSQQPYYSAGQTLYSSCNLVRGLYCFDDDQTGSNSCQDYETRYLCPQDQIGIGEVEQAVECDGEELYIFCQGEYYLMVHDAFYGRREEGLCSLGNNHTYPLDCDYDSAQVLALVQRNCDNKQECRLNMQLAAVLGDPCPGHPKYLDLKYTCERPRGNIALYYPTNASSTSTNDGSYAVDGNTKTTCDSYCYQSEEEQAPWWLVNLGIQRDVNMVTLKTCGSDEVAALVGAQIRIGNSPNFWENPVCGRNVTSSDDFRPNIYCEAVMSGQYISVEVPGRVTHLKLCEVFVFYIDRREQRAVACDGQTLQLSCGFASPSYLQIIGAFYGRAEGGTVCPHPLANHTYGGGCTASESDVLDIVRTKCNAERFCEVDVQSDVLDALSSDPCQGEFKYLEVTYQCNRYIAGELGQQVTAVTNQDSIIVIGCIGFKGVLDVTSATVKPSTTTVPLYDPQDPNIDVSSCADQDVATPIQNQCNNKKTCFVRHRHYWLGYTFCTAMSMQLELTFTCKEDVPSGDITLFACESLEVELSLTCPDGEYIKIQDAFYGRTQVGSSSLVCPSHTGNDDTTTCRSTDTLDIVKAYCQDQRSCSIPAVQNYLTSDDPCSSINSKYLEVTYNCAEGRPLNDLTLYSCEDHADLFLECPEEASHIRIISADLGRTEGQLRCSFRSNLPGTTEFTDCHTDGVLDAIRTNCTNKRNCTVSNYWADYTATEPCFGTYKYLQVTYRCLLDPAVNDPKQASIFFTNPQPSLKEYRLKNHVIDTSNQRNLLTCMSLCLEDQNCASFNFKTKRSASGHFCQLNDAIYEEAPSDFMYTANYLYFQRDSYREH